MVIQLNGNQVDLPEEIHNVEQLLSHYHLEDKIVVVEVNRDIIPKETYPASGLSNGDRVEIIHFVGGG
ncbi:sulfur carrier protein ThiS [Bacillus massiliglaciei]|uniref:sulfur carrier protein ThiS n=1 Tax=Bacillus massiliglaciei TaxID=1816693 RepID=UPI000DA5FE16|nr:sulfur carrier protein ThiS [Bacillus massiliglaciei]